MTEHQLQCKIINLLRWNKIMVFAVPNGGARSKIGGAILKKEGVLAGVSDLIVLLPNKCIFLEVKIQKGKQQKSQKVFQKNVESLGFEYIIIRSVDDVIKLFEL